MPTLCNRLGTGKTIFSCFVTSFKPVAMLALLLPGVHSASSQMVSDEALAECQAHGARFITVARHLPETDVALAEACQERNENSIGAWTCVDEAIKDAVQLLYLVGSGDKIAAPLFQGVADPGSHARLASREDEECRCFDKSAMSWGGNRYRPLRLEGIDATRKTICANRTTENDANECYVTSVSHRR